MRKCFSVPARNDARLYRVDPEEARFRCETRAQVPVICIRMISRLAITAVVLETLLACLPLHARDIPVADAPQFAAAAKAVQPGDTLVLAAGEWKDATLKINAVGTAAKPVVVRTATAGATVLSGASQISISGAHITIDGLHFKNPTGEEVIELRTRSDTLASDCRVTQCAVTNDLPATGASESARFISIYGVRNRIDHCLIQGKTTAGTTVVVWLGEDAAGNGRHQIDHNYFGPRERLGKNGGETIRVGDSETSMQSAACTVEDNVFERCNGEAECISNKSCGNVYQRNTFLAVSGTITLRHGNDCTVRDNVFLGQEAKGSGGIRIIGEGHRVTNNWLEGLRGDEERAALCFMLGIPGSPANGYFQVKGAVIEGNTIIDCATPIVIGVKGAAKAALPPIATQITGNIIDAPKSTAIDARCDLAGIQWEKNIIRAKSPGIPATPGISEGEVKTAKPAKITTRADVGPRWWP